MSDPGIVGAVASLPAAPPRHHWPRENEQGFRRLAGIEFADGCDRTEKTCPRCGLVKITVHPPQGLPWREWRTNRGGLWHGGSTPPCLPEAAA